MSVARVRDFQVRGAASYSPNGSFRLDWSDVPPLNLGHTYARFVELALDVTWANATGGALSVPEYVGRNVIQYLRCEIPGGHRFISFADQAGADMAKLVWAVTGETTPGPGVVTVGAGGTAVGRYKLFLPIGFLPGSIEPDDYNVPLAELTKAPIEGNWANGAANGDFDAATAGVTIQSATLRATVHLLARPELRVGPYLSWRTQRLSGIEERILAADHVAHAIAELPIQTHAAGTSLTEVFVPTTRTSVNLLAFDGVPVIEQVASADLVSGFDTSLADPSSRLGAFEGGTCRFLPIYGPERRRHKVTQQGSARINPHLRLVGTPTTPKVGMVLSRLLDGRNLAASLDAIGVPGDRGKLRATPKTFTKTALDPNSGPGGVQRLPAKVE